ncbi:MAG: hypothetical protein M1827_000857 [Pycnora praestabilis]|nr:MAG: hypothetical protein M1827_000857 [Pycnora praestabilis]
MSAPTSELSRLTIGSMAMGGPASSTDRRLLQGESGIVYDVTGFSAGSLQQATLGIQGGFEITVCRAPSHSPSGTYYAFQLRDGNRRIAVRFGSPNPLNNGCNACTNFPLNNGLACKHVFWLVDQLMQDQPTNSSFPIIPLSQDGSVQQKTSPLSLLSSRCLDSLAIKRNWMFEREIVRKDEVREMLSALELEKGRPQDYRVDVYSKILDTPMDADDIFELGDLEAIVFRLAVQDQVFFERLRSVITPDRCASTYFEEMGAQAKRSLEDLDEYIQEGPSRGSEITDVKSCGTVLQDVVSNIGKNLETRAPHGRSEAAEALVEILGAVCDWNRDAYADLDWERKAPGAEKDEDRNLYRRLIGKTVRHSTRTNPDASRDHFVLDILAALPKQDVAPFAANLDAILDKVVDHTAPRGYILKFENLVDGLTSDNEGGASSSRLKKRSGGGNGGNQRKRVK